MTYPVSLKLDLSPGGMLSCYFITCIIIIIIILLFAVKASFNLYDLMRVKSSLAFPMTL